MSHVYGEGLLKGELLSHLRDARSRTDELFQIVRSDALYERPIAERHRIIFYLGHVEAFDWNLIGIRTFGLKSFNKAFDQLFAFGIDPTGSDLPDDKPEDWPREEQIHAYNWRVRDAVDDCLNCASDDQIFWAVIEHRLMHAETLAYMLHWLPSGSKRSDQISFEAGYGQPAYSQVDIPSGAATLGIDVMEPFGWDNEYEKHSVEVPAFSIDQYKVTNGQFEEFVRAGGYRERRFWSDAAWDWITKSEISHPKFWKQRGPTFICHSMFGDIPFQPSWPVYVSHAEAQAYANWKGRALPTEAQFHRAAFGTPAGFERRYPWGNTAPQPVHGNFNFARWNPSPVDAHPSGTSAFGVADLVGNGWEWTSTLFEPFPGFESFSFYPEYSANFFDGKHYVLKGGSSRTASLLLRRSFRNWFQPFYPNIYASFRCVET
jgi:gamma-glutamyl hercynylcysteine S-oxide synthase